MSREQKKVQKKRHRRRNVLIVVVVLVVLFAGYLVTCFMPGDETILAGVSVNGTEVGGMTKKEAETAIQESFEANYTDASLQVHALETTYEVQMGDCIALDTDDAARAAADFGHGSFLTRGIAWIEANLFGHNFVRNPQVSDEKELDRALKASGISGLNTTVQSSYAVEGDTLVLTKGVTGVSADTDSLKELLTAAVDRDDYDTVIECPTVEGVVKDFDLQGVYDEVHTKKSNATLDPDQDYAIVKSVKGVKFDVDEAQKAFDAAEEGESVDVALTIKKPDISTKKLKKYLFRDELGSYTTNVGGTSARISNVSLAADTINGTILLPGETFSYNDVVGERTAERGYQKAPAYSAGETVQELGGGICQVSSTLYMATLLSNLEIVEHHNHTYISDYIGLGMDATVSWGSPDYQFKNDTDYPIKIEAYYSGGQVTCKILGAKLDDIHVEMTAETLQVNYRGTTYQNDSSLAEGKSEVVSSGHDGYVVQTYRNLYDGDGKLISSKEEAYCVYSKQDQVVRVGTKKASSGSSSSGKKKKKSSKKSDD